MTFDGKSTADEVLAGLDLTDRRVVVTGGAGGIGLETSRALARAGAEVTIATRDLAAAEKAAADVPGSRPARLDLTDLDSVAQFCAGWTGPLHALVNNAGVMNTPERRTGYGWELQFATNHLGHFALTLGLHDALRDARGRVVSVSSSGHDAAGIDFEDLFFERRPYDPQLAYGQSKTANVLFAVELTRRWAADGITANALMPGGIWTNLQRHWDPQHLADLKAQTAAAGVPVKTPQQGAATSVLLAAHPDLEGIGGRYFEDCHEAQLVDRIEDGMHGVRAHALDPVAATRLWDVSLELLDTARGRGWGSGRVETSA
jgi:NAD(P)-dependent dehydrogenase (short-subunit alcohol dehydrogenase family)